MKETELEAPTDAAVASSRPAAKREQALIAIIALAILWTLWQRYGTPPWPTFVGPPAADLNNVSFVIDYPDDWQPPAGRDLVAGKGTFVVFKRRPPSGLWRWWREHILHEDRRGWAMEQVAFTLMPAAKVGVTDMTSLFRYFEVEMHALGDRGVTRSQFANPLGAAIDEIRVIPAHSGQTTGIEAPFSLTAHKLTLFPHFTPGGLPVVITAEYVLPSDVDRRERGNLNRMMRSIRLRQPQ